MITLKNALDESLEASVGGIVRFELTQFPFNSVFSFKSERHLAEAVADAIEISIADTMNLVFIFCHFLISLLLIRKKNDFAILKNVNLMFFSVLHICNSFGIATFLLHFQ